MEALNPLFALGGLALALACGRLLVGLLGVPVPAGGFVTLDGLRGIVAFCVFLHHGAIWFQFTHEDKWITPPSNLYAHLGDGAVSCFFMINGLLFYTKILDAPHGRVDWAALYLSRIFRLVPLYVFAMLCLFGLVGHASGWMLAESPDRIFASVFRWLSFTVMGVPPINGVAMTPVMIGGVTWTLPYEWFFYLSLPVLALISGGRVPLKYVVLGLISLVLFICWRPAIYHLCSFSLGALTALLVRVEGVRRFTRSPFAALLALTAVVMSVVFYPGAHGIRPVLLYGVMFLIVAGGNHLFGLLSLPSARMLGEMSYSVYLLHGFVLYVGLDVVFGERAQGAQPVEHWLMVYGLVPVLIALCALTFHFIERPAVRLSGVLQRRLRATSGASNSDPDTLARLPSLVGSRPETMCSPTGSSR